MGKRKIIAMMFLLSLTGALSVLGDTEENAIPRAAISKYRSWLKVTPKPHPVEIISIDGIAD